MSSKFLKDHADSLSSTARETTDRAQAQPDDFFLSLAARNQRDAAAAVRHQQQISEAEEAGELIDLRLIGPRANGSISLDWFIAAMEPLSRAWKLAAHRLRYGRETNRRIPDDVVSSLNLKLAGIGYGSTRVFVTGNALPDLSGESLLQATLQQTFRLLNARNEEFYDAIDAVGGRSAHQLSAFMKALESAGLAAEFSWMSPQGRRVWNGRPEEITRIRALLDTIREPDRYEEMITGFVAGIFDTGRLEMRTDAGHIRMRFPLQLTDQVQRLTIKSLASVRVETSKYWDSVEKRDIFKRQLLSVESLGEN